MKNLDFQGHFAGSKAHVDVRVGLFQFEENGLTYIYSPAFDLTGYGQNLKEAKTSFEVALEEFLTYTTNKKTFVKVLNKLGWKVKTSDFKSRKIRAPELAELITKNSYLAEILNEKDFTKFDQTVSVPAFV